MAFYYELIFASLNQGFLSFKDLFQFIKIHVPSVEFCLPINLYRSVEFCLVSEYFRPTGITPIKVHLIRKSESDDGRWVRKITSQVKPAALLRFFLRNVPTLSQNRFYLIFLNQNSKQFFPFKSVSPVQ